MTSPMADASAERRARSQPLRAAWRTGKVFAGSCVFLLVWIVVKSTARSRHHLYELAARWTGYWARYCCRAAGFRVRMIGALPTPGTFLAPNHLGYADVLAIGSAVPCFFVAKLDVETWPFIGTLFKISHNIGVPRARVKALVTATKEIKHRLLAGQSVCVFLEGTSSGGNRLLPFYPPLVQPAIDASAAVCPVAIRWTSIDSAVDISEDLAYWRPEHTFAPHAWRLLGLSGMTAEIQFGQPIHSEGHTRKTLATAAQVAVGEMLGMHVEKDIPANAAAD
ncbi:MAG TPA: lysophospholipid acyltransferase family protein [Candidatus Hydrogenedentes bacterium]|nr:lysophospholipid acyltransferase family protein [Candidatus Hydrogenedentota bacterium]